jgi:hypothetical protein
LYVSSEPSGGTAVQLEVPFAANGNGR